MAKTKQTEIKKLAQEYNWQLFQAKCMEGILLKMKPYLEFNLVVDSMLNSTKYLQYELMRKRDFEIGTVRIKNGTAFGDKNAKTKK